MGVSTMRIVAWMVACAMLATGAAAADLRVFAPPAAVAVKSHLPDCADRAVLTHIARKFAFQDAVIVHSGLAILTIDNTRQTRLKDGPSLVDVRYCTGRAVLSNGIASEVVYIIEWPMKGPFSVGCALE